MIIKPGAKVSGLFCACTSSIQIEICGSISISLIKKELEKVHLLVSWNPANSSHLSHKLFQKKKEKKGQKK